MKFKKLGVVRKFDNLGRLTIPKDVRVVKGWDTGTPIEMLLTENGDVLLRSYENSCKNCGEPIEVDKEISLCDNCILTAKYYAKKKGI